MRQGPLDRRARGHGRDRPGGGRDDVLDRRRVHPDRLHGRPRRPVVQAVRADHRLLGAGVAVRVVLARPDAVGLLARSRHRDGEAVVRLARSRQVQPLVRSPHRELQARHRLGARPPAVDGVPGHRLVRRRAGAAVPRPGRRILPARLGRGRVPDQHRHAAGIQPRLHEAQVRGSRAAGARARRRALHLHDDRRPHRIGRPVDRLRAPEAEERAAAPVDPQGGAARQAGEAGRRHRQHRQRQLREPEADPAAAPRPRRAGAEPRREHPPGRGEEGAGRGRRRAVDARPEAGDPRRARPRPGRQPRRERRPDRADPPRRLRRPRRRRLGRSVGRDARRLRAAEAGITGERARSGVAAAVRSGRGGARRRRAAGPGGEDLVRHRPGPHRPPRSRPRHLDSGQHRGALAERGAERHPGALPATTSSCPTATRFRSAARARTRPRSSARSSRRSASRCC